LRNNKVGWRLALILVVLSLVSSTVSAADISGLVKTYGIKLVNALVVFAAFFLITQFIEPIKKLLEGEKGKKVLIYVIIGTLCFVAIWKQTDYIWKLTWIKWFLFNTKSGEFTLKPLINTIVIAVLVWFIQGLPKIKDFLANDQIKKIMPILAIVIGLVVAYNIALPGGKEKPDLYEDISVWNSKMAQRGDRWLFGQRTNNKFDLGSRVNPYQHPKTGEELYGILATGTDGKGGLFVFLWAMLLLFILVYWGKGKLQGMPGWLLWLLAFLMATNISQKGTTLDTLFGYAFWIVFFIVYNAVKSIGGEKPGAVGVIVRGFVAYFIAGNLLNLLRGEGFGLFPGFVGRMSIIIIIGLLYAFAIYYDKEMVQGIKSGPGKYIEDLLPGIGARIKRKRKEKKPRSLKDIKTIPVTWVDNMGTPLTEPLYDVVLKSRSIERKGTGASRGERADMDAMKFALEIVIDEKVDDEDAKQRLIKNYAT